MTEHSRWPATLSAWTTTLILTMQTSVSEAPDPYSKVRAELVRSRIANAGVENESVLQSIRDTPRHEFVPRSEQSRAYYDMALPIGNAQTISSPFIVAMMTAALEPDPKDKVLEIGTGSGYQAAVLSPLVSEVYTIEIVDELGRQARRTIQRLGYENIQTRIGDGFLGWAEAAPFDKIIVTCSPESVPQPLIDQLKEGGQMIIPVGERYQQTLYRMIKRNGKLEKEALRPTLFVPMTGTAENARSVKPDATNPTVVNGDFEIAAPADSGEEFVTGWYYGRQVRRVTASAENGQAAAGKSFVRCENATTGLSSHLLQGIPIDGRQVSTIRLAGSIRTADVIPGGDSDSVPMIALSLYDDQRRDLGTFWIGPFKGTRPWKSKARVIRIPLQTREAILRIGLFGATGTADFDEISVRKIN